MTPRHSPGARLNDTPFSRNLPEPGGSRPTLSTMRLPRGWLDGMPVFSGTVAYRGLIPAPRLQGWPECLVIWGGGGKRLLVFPVRGGELLNYVGFVPADEQMRESW